MDPRNDLSGPIMDSTADLLGLADVHRWVVVRTMRPQNVAEHSFNVMVIAEEICDRLGIIDGQLKYQALRWAMVHDAPETLTGDIDGKFKRLYPNLRKDLCAAENEQFPWYASAMDATPAEAVAIVKLADKIESILYIKTWGRGPRALDVDRELSDTIIGGAINMLASVANISDGQIRIMAYDIIHYAIEERGTIQFRS